MDKMLSPADANRIVEQQLESHLTEIENETNSDALAFNGLLVDGVDDLIREAIEKRRGTSKNQKLSVLLETSGGYITVAQRIADTFRFHYKVVDFIVPNYAMSAGTVLVMSGDAIFMDYYSVLGPIDPQVPNKDGRWVPALGYLHKYSQLVEKSKSKKGLTEAELAYFLTRFDPADLYSYEQARNLSTQLLEQWLVKYKFKDWNLTETRKKKVTLAMKKKRAKEIAEKLNDTERWSSHARPISMEVLRRDIELKIEDFGDAAKVKLNGHIKCYHQLLRDYMARRGSILATHVVGQYKAIGG
jgi:membrane-bound ClpP family serine protease